MTNKNIIQNKLKNIFSTHIVPNYLQLCNTEFKKLPESHLKYIESSIVKFLACRDIKKGFVSYKCPTCHSVHKLTLSCKSKLCPCCGYAYSQKWTDNTKKNILDIEHRHVLFTIPKECREFFFYDRSLLNKLATAVNKIFKYQFHNTYDKNKRVNKISKHSKNYFTDSDIVHYGLITVIHTFGRDLKWNPHIHAIVSLGGFTKNFKYKTLKYFNVNTIAGQWKYLVCDIISKGNYPDDDIANKAKKTVSDIYNKNTRFFFNIADSDINNPAGMIQYLGRYLARSPIAEYKITEITDNEVTFFYNDLKNDKKQTYVTMEINKFIQQVLIHLPPKNFKAISRFGFYARRINEKLKNVIKSYKKYFYSSRFSFYQKQIFRTFGVNPFYCFQCNIKMKIYQFYHFLDTNGVIRTYK